MGWTAGFGTASNTSTGATCISSSHVFWAVHGVRSLVSNCKACGYFKNNNKDYNNSYQKGLQFYRYFREGISPTFESEGCWVAYVALVRTVFLGNLTNPGPAFTFRGLVPV